MTRSMEFTALDTVAFADIPQPQMSDANTLFSTVFQLARSLGAALADGRNVATSLSWAGDIARALVCNFRCARSSRGFAVP
jgi:hypothetical protein